MGAKSTVDLAKDIRNSLHFASFSWNFTILEDLEDLSFEALWLKLRPARLPRGYSCIVLGTIYHPPDNNDFAILEYLSQCLSSIESRFSNCGLLLVGDFNRLNTKRLQNSFNLKQIVTFRHYRPLNRVAVLPNPTIYLLSI